MPAEARIPEPKTSQGQGGTIYSFALPAQWGVDGQVVPNLGLSEHVAVFSASHQHTERLLKTSPLAVGGVLTQTDRPLAVVAWFNWAGLVEAANPWVDFAADRIMASEGTDEGQKKGIVEQVHTAVDVLKAVRSITDESYLEDEALVHHTLLEIRDVEK